MIQVPSAEFAWTEQDPGREVPWLVAVSREEDLSCVRGQLTTNVAKMCLYQSAHQSLEALSGPSIMFSQAQDLRTA